LFGRFPIPFHAEFEEVKLRFYVRRKKGSDDRRGVVFIAEVVPRRAIATTAQFVYGENYTCLAMRHHTETGGFGKTAEYQWKVGDRWCTLSARLLTLRSVLTRGVWSSSSLATTGVIRLNGVAVASNITSHMPLGRCGRPLKRDLMGMPAHFMGANS
jgi:hypothetical protein